MQSRSLQITIKYNYAIIVFIVLLVHALIGYKEFKNPTQNQGIAQKQGAIRISKMEKVTANDRLDVRRLGSRKSILDAPAHLAERRFAPVLNNRLTKPEPPKKIALSDLSVPQNAKPTPPTQAKSAPPQRPGTRPTLAQENTKALNAISLKGKEISEFVKSSSLNAAAMSGDPRAAQLSDTDILVNLEVPEGVEPSELNKYELMFYGFQRRTAINYINAFYKNLDRFQRANPHLQFPLTDTKQVMTGRLTYDDKGNIKQIKMIRWSNEERLQGFFEEVLKEMDTLHNPPQALWQKSGEFSIFFSFVVNG